MIFIRTYYIFKIKKHYAQIAEQKPYTIYKTIEDLYFLTKTELEKKNNNFIQMFSKFDYINLNNKINNKYKDIYTYTKFQNIHRINDYFNSERTKLIINPRYLVIRTTKQIPTFFEDLNEKNNIFICDFINKDYFWLNSI